MNESGSGRNRAALAVCVSAALLCGVAAAQDAIDARVAHVLEAVDEYRQDREAVIIGDFVELLSIPNVATHLPDMERNADHIIDLLESRGFETRRLQAGNAPYVYAELHNPGAAETILIYAHFDGQPVQEENWTYPPFSPTLLDGPIHE